MSITFANSVGAFVIWLCKGRKTKLKDVRRADTWANWVVGYLTIIIFILVNIYIIGLS